MTTGKVWKFTKLIDDDNLTTDELRRLADEINMMADGQEEKEMKETLEFEEDKQKSLDSLIK